MLYSQTSKFDSVKVYCLPYNSENVIKIDQSYLPFVGDSLLIKNTGEASRLFEEVIKMRKPSQKKVLKKLRHDFNYAGLNIRALFIFYEKGKEVVIGISPQPLIFIDSVIYEKSNYELKTAISSFPDILKLLFPCYPKSSINKKVAIPSGANLPIPSIPRLCFH